MEPTIRSPAGESNNCGCIQIIDDKGRFNFVSCQKFLEDVKSRSYVVVSIIGPQSSGKSTLLNGLFWTTFAQMNASNGRSKTTHGIWLAKAKNTEPCTLVMDLEGTDGQERQDDTAFEKQSAVFALLIADVVLINMWYHDIGRQNAANRPLFETVFQAVVRSFSPRKTTLVFVIHDTDDGNVEWTKHKLKKDIQQIWNSVSKPKAHERRPFSAFYDIEVVLLPYFRHEHEQFENKVLGLRKWFHDSIARGVLAGDRQAEVDGASFSCKAEQLWDAIKDKEDLNLPKLKDMVAKARCEQIAEKQFNSFDNSEEWKKLCEAVQTQTISGFGKELSEMIEKYLSKYDEEATYFDEDVRLKKRKQLEEKLVQHVRRTCQDMLQRIKSESLENFKKVLEKALQGGEKFILAARKCVAYSITQFEEKYRVNFADARIDQANRDESVKVHGELRIGIASHINTVFEQKRGKGSAAQGLIPQLPASNASTACELPKGVGAIASGAAAGATNIASAVAAGTITTPVAVGIGLGTGVGAIGVAIGVKATNEKRKMKEVKDLIFELLNGSSSVCGENQQNVEELLEGLQM